MDKKFIRNRLMELIDTNEITPYSLSVNLSKGKNYINNVLNYNHSMSLDSLNEICNYFHISLFEFFKQNSKPLNITQNKILDITNQLDNKDLELLLELAEQLLAVSNNTDKKVK